MIDWIRKKEILNIIFHPTKYHVQIIARSDEVLKLLLNEDKFTDEDLEQVWDARAFDGEVEKEVYTLIRHCSYHMQADVKRKILAKF